MKGKNVLCYMVDQQPLSTPTAKVYNGGGQRSEKVELYADQQRSSIWREEDGVGEGEEGGSSAADSLAVVHGGSRGRCFA